MILASAVGFDGRQSRKLWQNLSRQFQFGYFCQGIVRSRVEQTRVV